MPTEHISLRPKQSYLRDPASCAKHSDLMATPSFQVAAATALLEYQRRVTTSDPALAAAVTFKLRGAQDYLDVLMNLGIAEGKAEPLASNDLTPPEEARASDLRGEF